MEKQEKNIVGIISPFDCTRAFKRLRSGIVYVCDIVLEPLRTNSKTPECPAIANTPETSRTRSSYTNCGCLGLVIQQQRNDYHAHQETHHHLK
ncbi:hypothetical protein DPMN_079773 [Dreissena polymorpha]|uniref:Uncharacterized protein n=1 Tax=Dreissena polymorpha TaxID=45954 RepID=A0A9D3YUD3_DREPO|nr:hypothetical protein DPMN_079773 [Dreissena polymorpha]